MWSGSIVSAPFCCFARLWRVEKNLLQFLERKIAYPMIRLVMMWSSVREECEWNEEEDETEEEGGADADCAEAANDVVRMSLASWLHVDGRD